LEEKREERKDWLSGCDEVGAGMGGDAVEVGLEMEVGDGEDEKSSQAMCAVKSEGEARRGRELRNDGEA